MAGLRAVKRVNIIMPISSKEIKGVLRKYLDIMVKKPKHLDAQSKLKAN